jgi:hypothetical protein
MRGGLYIETGFDYKEFFTEPKKNKERLLLLKNVTHYLQVNTAPDIPVMQHYL